MNLRNLMVPLRAYDLRPPEQTQALVGVLLQESFGTFLIIQLVYPPASLFGDTWAGWIQHFFCVMLHDYITNGAHVNPSVTIGRFTIGLDDLNVSIVRICAQLIGGILAFPVAERVLPDYIEMKGCLLGDTSLIEGCMLEFMLTFALLVILLYAADKVGPPVHRPIIAAGIRALIYFGWKTGPGLNPMLAFSWAMHAAPETINGTHFLVYWLSPIMGSIAASFVYVKLAGRHKYLARKSRTA